jgi:two-component system, chemotaxis family, CheB/CheR fusion protein
MASRRKGGSGKDKTAAPTRRRSPRSKEPDAVSARKSSDDAATPARVAVRPAKRPAPAPEAADDGAAAFVPQPLVVGIGASAGGLEAFSQIRRALPPNPGVAIIFIQHLAPGHESTLATLLSAQSLLPVAVASDGTRVLADHVYVNPPGWDVSIEAGVLRLSARPPDQARHRPIDAFLRSLAASAGERAVVVILSGTGEDGSDGLRDVKAEGGIVLAQQPDSAKFDSMPAAAIATGLTDLVLAPEELASALVQIGENKLLEAPPHDGHHAEAEHPDRRPQLFDRILALLRTGTGVDFRQYKRPTIERRVARRMVLLRLARLDEYVHRLETDPGEVPALFQDILILVTRFFRDPEAFELLRTRALPAILQAHRSDEPIRAWVAGCSTGEEAYSVAILLLEFLAEKDLSVPVQIFATDVSEQAIERARNGFYPAAIVADVSPPRLRRYFAKADGGYRIAKSVRDVCVFARHDITRDPPFSRMDLIVCRNVMIYLNAAIQQKVMTLFHYTLKPTGFLLLGSAETVGQHSDLFRAEDKRVRLYAKKVQALASLVLPSEYPLPLAGPRRAATVSLRGDARAAQSEADRILQERYAPPGVVVDDDLQIVQFRGHTGLFLEHAPGDPTMNVLKMARDGVLYGLRTALHSARRGRAPVRREGMRVRRNGSWQECAIEVLPLVSAERQHFLVLFHETGAPLAQPPRKPGTSGKASGRRRYEHELELQIASLQRELTASRDYLQPIIQELETANEELQSANEEILSANEELQSTNEELDTAKEELQSTNEELNTVNDELRARNEELSRANSDLENLLASVQIAIVIVARDLRIRRFTPMAERVLNLIPSDIGRPIGHIQPNIDCPDLEARINRVLDDVTPQECDVRDRNGKHFSLRIRPYKDIDNRIEGAVLALFEAQGAQSSESS